MDQLNLTEQEKREIARLVENKPLPDKYWLFAASGQKTSGQKNRWSLVWNGKIFEMTNFALPFSND